MNRRSSSRALLLATVLSFSAAAVATTSCVQTSTVECCAVLASPPYPNLNRGSCANQTMDCNDSWITNVVDYYRSANPNEQGWSVAVAGAGCTCKYNACHCNPSTGYCVSDGVRENDTGAPLVPDQTSAKCTGT